MSKLKFVHITDIHLRAEGEHLKGGIPSERFDACLDDIKKWHPDTSFAVISGDLSEFAEESSYQFLKSRLESLPFPCFLMIGNHDERATFLSVFDNHPQDQDGFIQHRHEADGNVFLFLDTTKSGANAHEGQLCEKRLAWFKSHLIDAGDKPTCVFMHHPPFDIGIQWIDGIKLGEAEGFSHALNHGRNIKHVFFGHVHRMTYVNWRKVPFTSLPSLNHQAALNPDSVDGRFCDEPPAYGVVLIERDQLTVHFNTFLQRNPLHQT